MELKFNNMIDQNQQTLNLKTNLCAWHVKSVVYSTNSRCLQLYRQGQIVFICTKEQQDGQTKQTTLKHTAIYIYIYICPCLLFSLIVSFSHTCTPSSSSSSTTTTTGEGGGDFTSTLSQVDDSLFLFKSFLAALAPPSVSTFLLLEEKTKRL